MDIFIIMQLMSNYFCAVEIQLTYRNIMRENAILYLKNYRILSCFL